MYYYLEQAGIYNPWDSKDCFVWASGDDVVCWVDPKFKNKVMNSMSKLTSKTKGTSEKPITIGLG
jgi:hypothetical protein